VTVDVGTTPGRSSATEGGVLRRGDGLDISAEERGSVFDPGHTTAEVGTGFGSRVVEAVAEVRVGGRRDRERTAVGRRDAQFERTGGEFA